MEQEFTLTDILFITFFWFIVLGYLLLVAVYGIYESFSIVLPNAITKLIHRKKKNKVFLLKSF